MLRRFAPAALALLTLAGCAGPAKLAQRSEEKLSSGESSRAWDLALRALQKDPGNARARAAATSAGNVIAGDWAQRIHALAATDSVAAAEQVLGIAAFRVNAARYAAIAVSPEEAREEQSLRQAAARRAYQRGVAELAAHRPKGACLRFQDALRFVPDYRNASALADRAYEKALTRVAFAPFFAGSAAAGLGRDVAAQWRDELARQIAPPDAHFTRILGSAAIEDQMSVTQLGRLTRDEAVRMARKAGAERVVWGSIGALDTKTRLHVFTDVIARRVEEKNAAGETVSRWVDVPVEVIARVRTVTVDVDYELIATRENATLAHQHFPRATSARVVWTSYAPEGDLGAYALVSDAVRAANPARVKEVETRWKEVCGDQATLHDVLEARRAARGPGQYDRGVLPRIAAGAAFVFLQELPPAEDLAYAALGGSWQPLRADLLRLDDVDDIDLGMVMVRNDGH